MFVSAGVRTRSRNCVGQVYGAFQISSRKGMLIKCLVLWITVHLVPCWFSALHGGLVDAVFKATSHACSKLKGKPYWVPKDKQ